MSAAAPETEPVAAPPSDDAEAAEGDAVKRKRDSDEEPSGGTEKAGQCPVHEGLVGFA
jgi:hypothetical protein